jgi:TolB-like protein/Tfp pilus assembly protein PilF
MSAQVKAEVDLEIAHILFIDTVGYSKLSISEQRKLSNDLNAIVRGTNCFREAEAAGKLIRLPTGDGMALVFADDPQAPVRCALEVNRTARESGMPLRMGIHSGAVSRVVDVNDRVNIAGAGINTAQRVMSCGDAGHILLSKRASEDLEQYPHWQGWLHEIGECEVKHGAKLSLVNFFSEDEDVGNRELPMRLREDRRARAVAEATRRRMLRRRVFAVSILLLAIAGAGISYWTLNKGARRSSSIAAEKSIAVLPFMNLSDDAQNAYFADGIMDEILTDLAKVADLKVISRTSVMQYKSDATRNLRDIAKALNVGRILEGSVQRSGGHVRINVQLIDARTDTHVWAEHYDSELADIFAIESDVSEKIVSALKSKLSPTEKAAIEEQPTADLVAYDNYIQAKNLIASAVFNEPRGEKLFSAISRLNDAIGRDPSFALAYYQLAHAHDQLFFLGVDRSDGRLALASDAIQSLRKLRPESGEAHLALAKHLYWGYLDYSGARRELDAAQHLLPNESLCFLLRGYIERRQGQWEQSIKDMERASELDPRNFFILQQLAISHQNLRRYSEMATELDRALAISPMDISLRLQRAEIEFDSKANTKPIRLAIEKILSENPAFNHSILEWQFYLALCDRDGAAAARALAQFPRDAAWGKEGVSFPRAWCGGLVARLNGDSPAAQAEFKEARTEISKQLLNRPNDALLLCAVGMIDAALGNKPEAIREGRRAVELLPPEKDVLDAAVVRQYLAVIYAWNGEKDQALQELRQLVSIPGNLSYGQLRLDPYWEPLRADPRFEKIVQSLSPK